MRDVVTTKNLGPRARKLAEVANGRLSREEAEEWARGQGLKPFAYKPDVPAADVMALDYWTAPMAAAWFIWRSPDAVRDQWYKGRQGWTIWERIPALRRPNSIGLWRLKRVGPATLAEVFSQAGLAKEVARSPPLPRSTALGANSMTDNPSDRMRLVLERGWLQAFRAPTGDVGEEAIPPGQWITLFPRLTRIPGNSASSRGPGSKTVLRGGLEEGSEILFPQAQVIDAEIKISREEFEWRLWTIAQIIGWLAYRNESRFRSLEQADLIGRAYHGLTYARDFENDKLESRLVELFLSGLIKGYQDGKEIGVGGFTRITSVWELSDIVFVRDDILTVRIATRARDQQGAFLGNTSGVNGPSAVQKLSSLPPAKRGVKPDLRESIQKKMQRDIDSGTWTLDAFKKAKGMSLAVTYKANRETVNAARKAVLLELSANVAKTNSDK